MKVLLILSAIFLATLFVQSPSFAFEHASSEVQQAIVDLNSADKKALMSLKGIGKQKAAAIIKYREVNGQFNSIEELKNIKGIGQSLLDKNKAILKV